MSWNIDLYACEPDNELICLSLENWLIEQGFYEQSLCTFCHETLGMYLIMAYANEKGNYVIDEKNPPDIINYVSLICWEYGEKEQSYWQWAFDFCQKFNWKEDTR